MSHKIVFMFCNETYSVLKDFSLVGMNFSEMGIETSDLHRSLVIVHAAGSHWSERRR